MNRHHLIGLCVLVGTGALGVLASPVGLELYLLLTLLLLLVLERLLLDRAEASLKGLMQVILVLGLVGLVLVVAARVQTILGPA